MFSYYYECFVCLQYNRKQTETNMKTKGFMAAALLLMQTGLVIAQKADTVRARVSYTFSIVEDTKKPDSTREEQMVLLLGKNASLYTSLDKVMEGERKKKEMEEFAKKMELGSVTNIKMTPGKRTTANDIYLFKNEKKMFIKQRLMNNYLTEEASPMIDWQLSNDTLTISGLKCQKATCHFKGRDYDVWYSPEIPFNSGPWKLNGLPGLIVQAIDSKKEVMFKFDGFESVKASGSSPQPNPNKPSAGMSGQIMVIGGYDGTNVITAGLIELPKDAIKTTAKELDNLREAMRKDPSGFVNSSLAGVSGDVKMVVRGSSSFSPATPVKKINTIELPETK